MKHPLVFYVRNRPQGCDVVDLALRTKRSFIGYPAWRPGRNNRTYNLRDSIVDLSCSDLDWQNSLSSQPAKWKKQISANRNLVREATPGSIILMPRPDRGLIYAGRVLCFELVDNPSWGNEYIALRQAQGKSCEPVGSHLADVAQGWRVDDWHEVPFSVVPVWIRKSLFGRATAGRIHPLPDLDLDPFIVLDKLIDDPHFHPREATNDLDEIERRLISDISPSSFEHLVVALL